MAIHWLCLNVAVPRKETKMEEAGKHRGSWNEHTSGAKPASDCINCLLPSALLSSQREYAP